LQNNNWWNCKKTYDTIKVIIFFDNLIGQFFIKLKKMKQKKMQIDFATGNLNDHRQGGLIRLIH
jgi:hypothetical protein